MKDQYGRLIDYLRISVTDRCNLRCVYCMPEKGVTWIPHSEVLTYEELLTVGKAAVALGIKHIKITGGEPLLRKNVTEFIGRLKKTKGIETVTLTTNGILLPNYIEKLSETGIDGINISLDTLEEKKFRKLTRNGEVKDVWKGIFSVLPYEQINVKINCVLAGKDWQKDAVCMAEIAKKYRIHVRFIELMPIQNRKENGSLEEEIKALLEDVYGSMRRCEERIGFGPSVYYELPEFCGKIGFISAVSHKFCNQCNRIRLSCDGKLRLCLQSENAVDLKSALRQGACEEELKQLLEKGLLEKPREHRFGCDCIEGEAMSRIGG